MQRSILALDIGGANLKAAHSRGPARTWPFELWRNPAGLVEALRKLLAAMPSFELLAVTMTGELCDCFETKREGVQVILDAVETVASAVPILVWQTSGTWADLAAARRTPIQTAASNWLALACYAGRLAPTGPALVIDIGSTTTDIIPLLDGVPRPQGRTDPERLRSRELVYTGVRRTPVCALLGGSGATEFFATTLDVYLVLGALAEEPDERGTADGRPATRSAARARLARMLCGDAETLPVEEIERLAQEIHKRQTALIGAALAVVAARLPEPPRTVVLAGTGEFLARQALRLPARIISLEAELGPERSRAACAHALAVLAKERET